MSQARSSDPEKEWQRLAQFSAYAFGDKTHTEISNIDGPFGATLTNILTPRRPDDPVSAAMFDALHNVLTARLTELSIHVSPNDPLRVSNYLKTYMDFKSSKPSTRKGYFTKMDTFVEEIGDLRVTEITRDHIMAYRDMLTARMEVSRCLPIPRPLRNENTFPSNRQKSE